jgi:hypothetical protein
MPRFDGTGPMGAGSMTGGARGFCNPAASGYPRPFGRGMGFGRGSRGGYGPGMGMRRGFGRGFGGCRWYPPASGPAYPADPAAEINMLKVQADSMQNTLDAINRRMAQLQEESTE